MSRLRLGRFGAVLVACIGGYFVAAGTQAYLEHIRFPQPQPVTYDQLVRSRPASGWYRIRGGWVVVPQGEVVGMVVSQTAYVPLRRPTDRADTPIRVFVHPADPKVMAAFDDLCAVNSAPEEQRRAFYGRNMARLVFAHDVVGLVTHGTDYGMIERADLLREDPRLAPDVIFVDEAEVPSLLRAAWKLGLGLCLMLLAAVEFARRPLAPPCASENG